MITENQTHLDLEAIQDASWDHFWNEHGSLQENHFDICALFQNKKVQGSVKFRKAPKCQGFKSCQDLTRNDWKTSLLVLETCPIGVVTASRADSFCRHWIQSFAAGTSLKSWIFSSSQVIQLEPKLCWVLQYFSFESGKLGLLQWTCLKLPRKKAQRKKSTGIKTRVVLTVCRWHRA